MERQSERATTHERESSEHGAKVLLSTTHRMSRELNILEIADVAPRYGAIKRGDIERRELRVIIRLIQQALNTHIHV